MSGVERAGGPKALVALLVGLLCVACTVNGGAPVSPRPLPDDASRPAEDQPSAFIELGPTEPDEVVDFSISLVMPGAAELADFLAGLNDPRSPHFGRYLDAQGFGARFGLPVGDVDAVVAWLQGSGMEIVARYPQRTSLVARGRAADVNRLFGVTLVDRQNAEGIRYHVPLGEPVVPAEMAGRVASVVGLDSEPAVRPARTTIYGAGVPGGGLRPPDVAKAYEIEELHAAGLRGEGQTVGIISFDTFNASDIAAWDQEMDVTGPAVEFVRLEGAPTTPGSGVGEVSLDIQVIRGIAPAAQIINYEAQNRLSNFGPLIARVVADGRVDIASISWGLCERYYPPQVVAANEQEFAAAFAAGISIFVASGDEGAYDCRRLSPSGDDFDRDLSIAVDLPAAGPSVIAVGGTFLTVRQDGHYYEEVAWEEPLGGHGTGGGVSVFHPRPTWQQAFGLDNAATMRQVPDVAGPADSTSGFLVIHTEPGEDEPSMGAVGGTSAAAPFWAGSMVLAKQLANQQGIPALGALGPQLYALAAEQPAGAVFHDIVRGGNLLHQAGPGWDYATGLGSPRVSPLARALVARLAGQ